MSIDVTARLFEIELCQRRVVGTGAVTSTWSIGAGNSSKNRPSRSKSVASKAAEVRNLQARVAEAEKRVAAGVAAAEAELTLARIDLLKARGELVQAVAEYQISDVKLRQAMGMLVRE